LTLFLNGWHCAFERNSTILTDICQNSGSSADSTLQKLCYSIERCPKGLCVFALVEKLAKQQQREFTC